MKRIFSFLLLCILLTGCGQDYQTIDSNQAMEIISNNNPIIIDVRNSNEYRREHIKNAINIPLENIESIKYDKNDSIILYCNFGEESKQAANKLNKLGYKNIYTLDGGLLNWGFDLEE